MSAKQARKKDRSAVEELYGVTKKVPVQLFFWLALFLFLTKSHENLNINKLE
jgi:hypothetical protein